MKPGSGGVRPEWATTLNQDHGRIERRECCQRPSCLEYLSTGQDWPGLRSPAGPTVQPRYYISSLDAPAERLLKVVRTHWSIENSLHWSLDVTFGEDHCIRKDHAPQNMATLRPHNLLKNETSLKVGIQGKRLQAGWKEDYLPYAAKTRLLPTCRRSEKETPPSGRGQPGTKAGAPPAAPPPHGGPSPWQTQSRASKRRGPTARWLA